MTIEAKIDALIAALNANTNALTANVTANVVKAEPPKPAKAAKETPPPAAADAPKALTYDSIKEPFLALVKNKGREAGVEVLKSFGAEKLPDIKPEKFADVLAAITRAAAAQAEGALV